MIEYRKFRLKTSDGQYYELTNPEVKHFLHQPMGLGFRGTVYGYRFKNRFKRKSIEYSLPVITGTIIFHEDLMQNSYELYYQFVQSIQNKTLEIEYLTPQNDEDWTKAKYAECEIIQLDKTEVDEYGLLRTPIIIQCYTFWRDRELKTYIALPELIGEQLQIPMNFPFYFGYDSLRAIEIENDGTTEVPLTIDIIGTSINPTYKIFDENGKEYGAGKFYGTFTSVRVESETEIISLTRNGALITNPAKYEDLTIGDLTNEDYYLTFLNIKPGRNLMTVGAGSTFSGQVVLTWRDEYISF